MELNLVLKINIEHGKEMHLSIFDERGKLLVSEETTCDDLAVPLELDPLADRFTGHPVLRERIELVQLLIRALETLRAEFLEELKHRISGLILDFQKKSGMTKADFAKVIGISYMKLRSICERTSQSTLPEVVALIDRWEKRKAKEEKK